MTISQKNSIINMKLNYNLTNDYLFKLIFSNEEYLKYLLQVFFNYETVNIKYLNRELLKYNFNEKAGIVDLLIDADGEIIHLELQNLNRYNLEDRIEFYSSKLIGSYALEKGNDYKQLKPVRTFIIINYPYKLKTIKNIVKLKVLSTNYIFNNKKEYKILNLYEIDKNKLDSYNELYKLFKINDFDILDRKIKEKLPRQILEDMKKFNLNKEDRKNMEDIVELMRNEKEDYGAAYECGVIDGEKRGKKIGEVQGKKLGIASEKINIAKTMIQKKFNLDSISEITGLSIKELSKLNIN